MKTTLWAEPNNMAVKCTPMRYMLLFFCCMLPGMANSAVSQLLDRQNFRSSVCNIADLKVEFQIDEAFGEPLITSKMRWLAGPNTSGNCLSSLTHLWLKVRTESSSLRYIKVSPKITESGEAFGRTATESPSWSMLFCHQPTDSAACESAVDAESLYASHLRFEGVEVVTEARAVANRTAHQDQPVTRGQSESAGFSLDSLLSDVIDNAMIAQNANGKQSRAKEPVTPEITEEERALRFAAQQEEHAGIAMDNVVSLISSSLAQYRAPAHECESGRTVGNWVQAQGTCNVKFRSETDHQYLCTDNGSPKGIRSTQNVNINLRTDLSQISDIRVSEDGWATLVLELNSDLQSTSEGNYKTNRWQLVVDISSDQQKLDDLEQFASSLVTLKEFCEASPT